MVIRMGARGGIEPVEDSGTQRAQPSRSYRRLTRDDRTFIEMAINSTPAWSMRAIAAHLAVAVSTVARDLRRHRVETGRGYGPTREFKYHSGVAHHHTMRARRKGRAGKLDHGELRGLVVAAL